MIRLKILLLIPSISDYRVDIYNLITNQYDLTVAYNDKDNTKSRCDFKKVFLPTKKLGPYWINYLSFYRYCRSFDAVVFAADVHSPCFCSLPFIPKMPPVIPWTIGTRASYKRKYDLNRKKGIRDYVTYLILKHSDAVLFYMDQAIQYWKGFNLNRNKIFIAHNTTSVIQFDQANKKNQILFVGTLYKEKGLGVLLENYKEAYTILGEKTPSLVIVGGGDEYNAIKEYCMENGLNEKVSLLGAIYDEPRLCELFTSSLACISPNQAGLSVLKSMGYGVPFITCHDAFTGGEIFNIEHGKTGITYERDSDLKCIIIDIANHPDKYVTMGEKAKSYYYQYASPEIMAQGVIESIEYALSNKTR